MPLIRKSAQSPEEHFKISKAEEKKNNHEKAAEHYYSAFQKYEEELSASVDTNRLKTEIAILYFRSLVNFTFNLFKFEYEKTDEFDIRKEICHIQIIKERRRWLLKSFPQLLDRTHSIERSFLKKLEEWLTAHGELEDAHEIYLYEQKIMTKYILDKITFACKKFKIIAALSNSINLFFRYTIYRLYLGYGVQLRFLIFSALIVILLFAWLFSKYHCVVILKCTSDYWKGLYASIMTFISFGFDEVAPRNTPGRILVCIEGVLGFITFGGIVAHIWRKIK